MLGDDLKNQRESYHACQWFDWPDKDLEPKRCARYAMMKWDGVWLCPVHMSELHPSKFGSDSRL